MINMVKYSAWLMLENLTIDVAQSVEHIMERHCKGLTCK